MLSLKIRKKGGMSAPTSVIQHIAGSLDNEVSLKKEMNGTQIRNTTALVCR